MADRERGNWEASLRYVALQGLDANSVMLDIGCNRGTLVSKLIDHGFADVYGIDINVEAINQGKEINPLLRDRIASYDGVRLPFDDECFDVVMSFDVIEHLPDLDQHFLDVRRVLKSGGVYIFQTPNKLINIPWEVIQQRSFTRWKGYHRSLQTPWSLKALIGRSGFRLCRFDKQDLETEHNFHKVRRQFGSMGAIMLKVFNRAPTFLFPHMWCVIQK